MYNNSVYPLDGDLSGGQRYPSFEQLGPGVRFSKDPKIFGPVKAPEKFPKTISGVSQNARGFRTRKKLVVFPRNFTAACVLPKKVKTNLGKV